jgi:hypothetical protein
LGPGHEVACVGGAAIFRGEFTFEYPLGVRHCVPETGAWRGCHSRPPRSAVPIPSHFEFRHCRPAASPPLGVGSAANGDSRASKERVPAKWPNLAKQSSYSPAKWPKIRPFAGFAGKAFSAVSVPRNGQT